MQPHLSLTFLRLTNLSQILSFVFEQRLDQDARKRFPGAIWEFSARAKSSLLAQENAFAAEGASQPKSLDDGLQILVQNLSSVTQDAVFCTLLQIFISHCVLLPRLSLSARAQDLPALHPDLNKLLTSKFLPAVYGAARKATPKMQARWLDVDGRVFVSLLHFLLSRPGETIVDAVGPDVSSRTAAIISSAGAPAFDLEELRKRFPTPDETRALVKKAKQPEPLRGLLRFSHPVLDEALEEVTLNAEIDEDEGEDKLEPDYMRFGRGTVFSDTAHW
jgi:hypothetical protein